MAHEVTMKEPVPMGPVPFLPVGSPRMIDTPGYVRKSGLDARSPSSSQARNTHLKGAHTDERHAEDRSIALVRQADRGGGQLLHLGLQRFAAHDSRIQAHQHRALRKGHGGSRDRRYGGEGPHRHLRAERPAVHGPRWRSDLTFNEAVSFYVECEDQEEVDHFWEQLSAVPEAEQCGWLKDRFGLSWQIVPWQLGELLESSNKTKALAAMNAMLKMKKIVIADLQLAFDQA